MAVVRLRALLAREISDEERQTITVKLGEALVASGEFTEALQVLDAGRLRDSPAAKFFQAQAYAGLSRWAEALPRYQVCASDIGSPFRMDALFGQAESQRALGRTNEALQTLELLRRDRTLATPRRNAIGRVISGHRRHDGSYKVT